MAPATEKIEGLARHLVDKEYLPLVFIDATDEGLSTSQVTENTRLLIQDDKIPKPWTQRNVISHAIRYLAREGLLEDSIIGNSRDRGRRRESYSYAIPTDFETRVEAYMTQA